MSSGVHVIWRTPGHVFATNDDLIVQIRGEALSLEALEAQETGLRLARAQHRPAVYGALLVIAEGAPAPTGEVAKRQREMVREFAADERVHIALVLEGRGPLVALKRTIARGVFTGARRTIARNVNEGARWLAAAYGEPSRADEIVALVDSLRRSISA